MANSEFTAESDAGRIPTAADAPISSAERSRGYALDGAADALYFLDNVQPLAGCDFSGDEEFANGRSTITRLIEEEVRRRAWPDSPAYLAPTETAASVDSIIDRAFATAFNEAVRARAGNDVTIGTVTEEFIATWRRVADDHAARAGMGAQ